MTYILRYARVVILERTIEVPDDIEDKTGEAFRLAHKLESEGELDIANHIDHPGVVDVQDYAVIWEVRPA